MNSKRCVLLMCLCLSCLALEPIILEDMSKLELWKPSNNRITVEAAAGFNGGKAVKISKLPLGNVTVKLGFNDDQADAFNLYQGISFRVKGDGSDCWSPVCLQYSYGSYCYQFFVPLKNTDWVKYTVAWQDFIPENQHGMIGEHDGIPPCGISSIRIGCRWNIWFNNDKIPEHSMTIADIQLEPVAPRQKNSYKPAPFAAFLEKLKNGGPVKIQCQGDSITAGTSLGDKLAERYSIKTEELLRSWLKNDQIVCLNRAVGGARMNDLRAWLQRDFIGGTPDLVTVWCGYNDKSGCYTVESYKRNMADYIDRVAEITKGQSAMLLFVPGPGKGARYTMMDDFAQAIRELAAERNLPCFDVQKVFKAYGKKVFSDKYMADTAHPNAAGHECIADALCEYLVRAAGITTPKPPEPVVENHTFYRCDFEGDCSDWLFEKNVGVTVEKAQAGAKSLKLTCLDEPGKDHVRAWSKAIPVVAGQKFIISGDLCASVPEMNSGVYMAVYSVDDGSVMNAKLSKMSGSVSGSWTPFEKEYKVPKGIACIRILFWASKDTVGNVYLDNLSLSPAK